MPARDIADARRAIAAFVDGNIAKLDRWLNEVAEGRVLERKEIGEDGVERVVETVVLVEPNPAKAIELVLKASEFYVPKLAHTEVDVTVRTPEQDLADAELLALIDRMRKRVAAASPAVLEVEPEPEQRKKPGPRRS